MNAMALRGVDPPAGSLVESVALARLLEVDQINANKELARQRNGFITRMRAMRARGATPEAVAELEAQLKALPASPCARDVAAAAVGLAPAVYVRAQQIVAAAEREPERFGDLLPMLETRGAYPTYTVYCKRRGVVKARKSMAHSTNPLLHKSHRPQHNDMVDRAVRTLEGAVMGLKLVDVSQLDYRRISPWLAVIADTAFYLQALHKEMLNLYDQE